MNLYIGFLLVIFVLAGFTPRLMRRPWIVLGLSLLLCIGFYSPRFFG